MNYRSSIFRNDTVDERCAHHDDDDDEDHLVRHVRVNCRRWLRHVDRVDRADGCGVCLFSFIRDILWQR